MQIREGAYYRTRRGDVVGPMRRRDDYLGDYCWESGTDCWTEKGEFEKGRQWEHDLISEVYVSNTPPADAPAPEVKTLRDEFAMVALPVAYQSFNDERVRGGLVFNAADVAERAYQFATAMMEALAEMRKP